MSLRSSCGIALYGDSLALPRQGLVRPEERYFYLLETWIRTQLSGRPVYLEVKDRARAGASVPALWQSVRHDHAYFEFPRETMILHAGIVDCAPRPIHGLIRSAISLLPTPLRNSCIHFLHAYRAAMIRYLGGAVVTRPRKFAKRLGQLLEMARGDYERVYVINICPTIPSVEERSPGYNRNVATYNHLIEQQIVACQDPKLKLIDVHAWILAQPERWSELLDPQDGHHITPATNRWLFEQILVFERAFWERCS